MLSGGLARRCPSGVATTLIFPAFVSHYLSIEHGSWFANKHMKAEVAGSPWSNRVCYTHADCGFVEDTAPGREGWFMDERANARPSSTSFYNPYFEAVPQGQTFDRFLVDGRVRPQLALFSLMLMRTPEDAIVFVHDFSAVSREYQDITLEHFVSCFVCLPLLSPGFNLSFDCSYSCRTLVVLALRFKI